MLFRSQTDHVGSEAEADDHAVRDTAGQLQRPRPLGGEIDGHAARRSVDPPAHTVALDRRAAREAAERDDGILEARHRGRRCADRGDRAVARADPEHGPAARHLVDARDGAGGDDEVPCQRVGDEGPEPDPRCVESGQGERDIQLAEHRLRVGDAEPVESALLDLTTQSAEPGQRLGQEDDSESGDGRHGAQHPARGKRAGDRDSGLPHIPRRRGYWITMAPFVRLPVMLYPSVKTRVKTPGARSPLSTAIIVKPTGSPLFTPVPTMVTVCRPSSTANAAEVIAVDLKSVPEPGSLCCTLSGSSTPSSFPAHPFLLKWTWASPPCFPFISPSPCALEQPYGSKSNVIVPAAVPNLKASMFSV